MSRLLQAIGVSMLPTLNARGEWVVVEHVSQLAASIKGNEVCARTSAALLIAGT